MIKASDLFKIQLETSKPLTKSDISVMSELNKHKFIEGDKIVHYCIQEFDADKWYLSFNLTSLRLAKLELVGYELVSELSTDTIIILRKII